MSESGAPVEHGEEYVFDIEEIGREGDGIGYVEDFTIIVPDAAIGDRVRVEIERVESDFAVADLLEHESDVA